MAEEVVDALVLAARFDEQGLAASERAIITRLESISAAVSRTNATGQSGPFRDLSRDIVAATAALRRGELSLAGYNEALQFSRTQMIALRQAGYEPNAKQLNLLTNAIDRTALSLARQSDAARTAAQTGRAVDEQLGKVAKGADSTAAGVARARSGLAQLAVTSLGTSAAVGQVTQGLLFLSGFNTSGIIAVAASVAVLAKAYELLTAGQRKAVAAQEELVKALASRAEGLTPERAKIFHEVAAAIGLQARAQLEVNKLQEEAASFQGRVTLLGLADEIRLKTLSVEMSARQLTIDQGRAALLRLAGGGESVLSGLGRELAGTRLSPEAAADAARRNTIATTDMTDAQRSAALVMADLIFKFERVKAAEDEAAKAAADLAQFNKQLQSSYESLDAAALKMALDFKAQVEKGYQDARKAAEDFAKATRAAVDSLPTPDEIHTEFIRDQRDAFLEIADAAAGLANTAHSVGLIGDQAADAITGVIGLADALNNVALFGATTGNVLGAINAGVGLLGGLFGESAIAREHEQTIRDNSQALRESTAAIRETGGVGGLLAGQVTVADLQAFREARGTIGKGVKGGPELPAGFDLKELARQAATLGIDILDSKGRLIAGTLDQLDEAFRLAIEAATTFGKSFDEQARATDLRSKLLGESQDQASQFARELATISGFSPAVKQAFAGVDLGDKDAVRQAALRLFDQFQEGFFTAHPELFGDISKEDFLDFLGDAADSVNAFDDAVNAATKGLLNIPETFKLASAEFAARAVDLPGTVARVGPPLRGIDILPRFPSTAAAGPSTAITGNTFVFNITPSPNMSSGDLARRVRGEFDAEAAANFGLAPPP